MKLPRIGFMEALGAVAFLWGALSANVPVEIVGIAIMAAKFLKFD